MTVEMGWSRESFGHAVPPEKRSFVCGGAAAAAALGMIWLATVPLTAGLVGMFFGARYLGMLCGVAFLSHQVGGFLGVWLGGRVYDLTGSCALIWYLGIMLEPGSAAIHLPVREKSAPRFSPVPA